MGLPHPSNRAPRKKQRAGLKGIRQLATHRNSLQSRKHSVSALCLTRAALGLTVALPFVNAEQPDFALFCADTLSRATFAKAGCPAALPRSKGVVFTREAIRLSIPRLCNSQRVWRAPEKKCAHCARLRPRVAVWAPLASCRRLTTRQTALDRPGQPGRRGRRSRLWCSSWGRSGSLYERRIPAQEKALHTLRRGTFGQAGTRSGSRKPAWAQGQKTVYRELRPRRPGSAASPGAPEARPGKR